LSSTAVTFEYAAVGPVVSDWQEFTAAAGSNLAPTDGSTVTMIYNRITPDNYTLRASDRFRYLRSDTQYEKADIVALLADGDLSEITPAGAQPEYTGNFLMPGTGQYLYLVWDYSDGSTPPEEFLLDTYTGAAAGYSVRRLATSATVLLRVRRETAGGTGDDDEADVAYDSNNILSLDSAISNASAGVTATTLGQFLNVGTVNGTTYTNPDSLTVTASCYVDTWYDQSGNANNAEQTAFGSQPQIHNGTVNTDLITENGKPALQGVASGSMNLGSALSLNAEYFITFVNTTVATDMPFGGLDGSNLNGFIYFSSVTTTWRTFHNGALNGFTGFNIPEGSQVLHTLNRHDTNQITLYLDGSSIETETQSATLTVKDVGGVNGSFDYRGKQQEIIFWESDQDAAGNRTGIETNINTYFSIYT